MQHGIVKVEAKQNYAACDRENVTSGQMLGSRRGISTMSRDGVLSRNQGPVVYDQITK